jgi:hypothetical protein
LRQFSWRHFDGDAGYCACMVRCCVKYRLGDFAYPVMLWLLAASLLPACNTGGPREDIAAARSAVVGSNDVRVLGFESVGDWTASAGTASLALGSAFVEGSHSLAVSNAGYVELTSSYLSSLVPVDDTISLDVQIPKEQPNLYWSGQVMLSVDCPSRGLHNQFIQAKELAGLPTGQFNRLTMVLPSGVRQALSAQPYTDLRFRVVLNVAHNASAYLFDRLWLNAGLPEPVARVQTVHLPMPARMRPDVPTLLTSEKLTLDARANVVRNGPSTSVNTGSGTLEVGAEAAVGRLWSTAPIILGNRAQASRVTSAASVSLLPGAVVTGTTRENVQFRPIESFDWPIGVPSASMGDRTATAGTLSLLPGRYGSVVVSANATLALAQGDYYFEKLSVAGGGKLNVDEHAGATRVCIESDVVFSGSMAALDGEMDSLLVVALTNAAIGLNGPFDGTFVAPNAALTLSATNADYHGAFFARTIRVSPSVGVQFRPFTGWSQLRPGAVATGDATSRPIPLPNTPAGVAVQIHLETMFGVGDNIKEQYAQTLADLRSRAAEVIPIVQDAYAALPADEYDARWSMVEMLSEIQDTRALAFLGSLALSPVPASSDPSVEVVEHKRDKELMIRARAVHGLVKLAQSGSTQADQVVLQCVSNCESAVRTGAIDGYVSFGDRTTRKAAVRSLLPPALHFLTRLDHNVAHTGGLNPTNP